MKSKLKYPILAISLLLGLSSTVRADWLPWIGRPGPNPNTVYCLRQYPITGLKLRAGQHIDAIQGVCWDGFTTPWFGGSGGDRVDLICSSGSHMKGIQSEWGDYVSSLQIACHDSSLNTWNWTAVAGQPSERYSALRCPGNFRAKGFKVESGVFVDRLSFFCAG